MQLYEKYRPKYLGEYIPQRPQYYPVKSGLDFLRHGDKICHASCEEGALMAARKAGKRAHHGLELVACFVPAWISLKSEPYWRVHLAGQPWEGGPHAR